MRRRNCALVLLLLCGYLLPGLVTGQQRSAASASNDSAFSPASALIMSCGMDQLLFEQRKSFSFVILEASKNNRIASTFGTGSATDTIVLPVVFHIINNNPASISDAQIAAAVADLNDAYAKRGAYSASAGADTRIRFGLARKDPNGGNTTGINRVTSFFTDKMNMYTEDSRLKNLHVWDPNKYINIWVVSSIVGEISADFGCGVWTRMNAGGYATMPTSGTAGAVGDGIVVTGFGALLAHEMGHYLGLYHTFEGGCTNNNCLTDGDKVCDTPPDGTTRGSSCTNPINSCTTDTLSNYSNGFFRRDTTDQVANFMDYNNSCSNQFTEGQAERMRAAITALRPGLLPDVLVKPCSDNITASFTRDKPYPVVGDQITFTNTSTGASIYRWLVNDVSIATGPDITKTIPATAQGKVKITLYAYLNDVNSNCYASFTDYVIVNCGVTARFYNDKKTIASKANILLDTIHFVNNSVGATAYQWFMSNSNATGSNPVTSNAGGNAADLNYAFGAPGTYNIKLIANNGGCADTTQQLQVSVLDPTPDIYLNMTTVNCYQETKVRVQFYFCNSGYAPIKANLPVSFYDGDPRTGSAKKIDTTFIVPDSLSGYCCSKVYTVILDVGKRGLNQLFAVVNDNGSAVPVQLPNTSFPEKYYTNNVSLYSGFKFKVTTNVTAPVMEPGDTLALSASSSPDAATFIWSSGAGLSCTTCSSPFLYADTNITKRVIANSNYACADTAFVTVLVPPANDYTINMNGFTCIAGGGDSVYINFTVNNSFKRGTIPKDLAVSFYKGDPNSSGAVLIAPVFKVPGNVATKTSQYSCKIKKIPGEALFASVNDNAASIPVVAANFVLPEKLYTNNITSFSYIPIATIVDTTICTGDTYAGYNATGVYTDVLLTKNGCDSVRTLRLTVRLAAVTRTTINASVCAGETFEGHTVAGTYVDVFKGVNACDSIRTLILTVKPVVNKTYTIDICKGQSYPAAGKLQTKSGIYKDTTKSYQGCDSITVTTITVHDLPAQFLPADTSICLEKTLPIDLSVFSKVQWNTGSTHASINITDPGLYSATVIDQYGCQGSDSVSVIFTRCIPVQIPTAFTPNHDGKNDMFKPVMSGTIRHYKLEVFNRWGEMLFETSECTKGWNGQYKGESQPTGTYVFFLSFTDGDGNPIMRKGSFVLLR